MAIVLDINLLCEKILDLNITESLLRENGVRIKSIISMDNWRWENEQKVENLNDIKTVVDYNKIVVVQMEVTMVKDVGIYIEKIDNNYLYTLWINTEGYPMLDYDTISLENKRYYEKIYRSILGVEEKYETSLGIIGIGLETDFYYSKNVVEIIKKSRNMLAWIVKGTMGVDDVLKGYEKTVINKLNRIIFEKV